MAGKPYRRHEAAKTTTLSLLKNKNRPHSTEGQIKALEAKLNAMKHSPLAAASASAPTPGDNSVDQSGASRSGSEAPYADDAAVGEAEAFMSEMQAEFGGEPAPSPSAPGTTQSEGPAPPAPTLTKPSMAAGLPQKPSQETLSQARELAKMDR